MAFHHNFCLRLCLLVLGLSYGTSEPWVPTEALTTRNPKSIPTIEFHVEEVKSVIEEQYREVSFGINWGDPTLEDRPHEAEYLMTITSENSGIMEIMNSTDTICIGRRLHSRNYTFTVKGVFLGYTKAKVSLRPAPLGCESLHVQPIGEEGIQYYEVPVSVIRHPSVLVDVVTGIMAALVAFNYVNMGVQLNMQRIGEVLKKPIGPAIGFICQFLFMPLASYGVSHVLLEDVSLRLGLFTLGCSPGGSMSNFWTLLFNGDVNLSMTMTFISTVAALAMMPLWIFTLGRNLFRTREATIPYVNLAGSLIMLTIPIGIGLLIQQYSPRLTKLSEKIIKPVTLTCVVFGVFVGLYANSFVFFLITWQVVVSGLCIAWGGYSFGAAMAWIFRLDRSQIVAVSIETAFQNAGVAFVMLLISLPQPEADLTAVPVITQLILTGMPMWILFVITRIYNKCKKVKSASPELDEQGVNKEYTPVATDPLSSNNNSSSIRDGYESKSEVIPMSSPA